MGGRDTGVEVGWNFHFLSTSHVTLSKVFARYSYKVTTDTAWVNWFSEWARAKCLEQHLSVKTQGHRQIATAGLGTPCPPF